MRGRQGFGVGARRYLTDCHAIINRNSVKCCSELYRKDFGSCEIYTCMLYVQYVMNFDFIPDFDKLVMHINYTEIIGNSHILDVQESLHHYSTQSMI